MYEPELSETKLLTADFVKCLKESLENKTDENGDLVLNEK